MDNLIDSQSAPSTTGACPDAYCHRPRRSITTSSSDPHVDHAVSRRCNHHDDRCDVEASVAASASAQLPAIRGVEPSALDDVGLGKHFLKRSGAAPAPSCLRWDLEADPELAQRLRWSGARSQRTTNLLALRVNGAHGACTKCGGDRAEVIRVLDHVEQARREITTLR